MIARFSNCDPRAVSAVGDDLPDGITLIPEVDPIQTRGVDWNININVAIDLAQIALHVAAGWVAGTALRLGSNVHLYVNGYHVRDEAEIRQRLAYEKEQHKHGKDNADLP